MQRCGGKIIPLVGVLAAGLLAAPAARAESASEPPGVKARGQAPPRPDMRAAHTPYRSSPLVFGYPPWLYVGESNSVYKYTTDVKAGPGAGPLTRKKLEWQRPLDSDVVIVAAGKDYVAAATDSVLYLLDARTGEHVGAASLPKNLTIHREYNWDGEKIIGITTQNSVMRFDVKAMIGRGPNAADNLPH